MPTLISPLAGKPAPRSLLVDVPRLVTGYYTGLPDPTVQSQRVAFGTSGHRGSSLDLSFNEQHVLAITQAICQYRQSQEITGPLFLGIDTHALSQPACATAIEVLAANGVDVMLATNDDYTPTPAVSHAILAYNRGRTSGLADGIVVTPSHNPPDNGGFKYNPPNGGPAGSDITGGIEAAANRFLETSLTGVKRMSYAQALHAATTHRHDFVDAYVADLGNVIDFDVIRDSKVRIGVDPLGGAGVHYWARIAEHYRLHVRRLGWQDSYGSFVTLCNATSARYERPIRYRVRLRYRSRSPRYCYAHVRFDATQPLPYGCHRLFVQESELMERARRDRQDGCQHQLDRPRRNTTWSKTL